MHSQFARPPAVDHSPVADTGGFTSSTMPRGLIQDQNTDTVGAEGIRVEAAADMSSPFPFTLSADHVGSPTSPRRQRPDQPPTLLTASLSNARNLGYGLTLGGQTPISNTSLSSPFSPFPHSPYSASPGGAVRGPSPMALRSAPGFATQYNPQQWGRMGSNESLPIAASHSTLAVNTRHMPSRTTMFAARPVGPDEPVASPPPPYSPQRLGESHGDGSGVVSPSDTMSPGTDASHGTTPTSAATTISPDMISSTFERRSPIAPSMYQNCSPITNQQTMFPPPPTPSSSRFRSSSKNHADRLLTAMNLKGKHVNIISSPVSAIDSLQHHTALAIAARADGPHPDLPLHPPAARRAASTGAIGLGLASSSRSASSSVSPSRQVIGMPLPPPPPGPPPSTSTRSQSLCRPSETSVMTRDVHTAPRARVLAGHGSNLEPVPPTPADWSEDMAEGNTTSNAASTWPRPRALHIDTVGVSGDHVSQDSPVVPRADETSSFSHGRSVSAAGALLRSPAIRNRSAKGIRERRSESRNGKSRHVEDLISVPSSGVEVLDAADEMKPGDLILPLGSGSLSRRRLSSRLTPRSSKNIRGLDEALENANARAFSGHGISSDSARSTPRYDLTEFPRSTTPTSPLPSSRNEPQKQVQPGSSNAFVPSSATPTPPLQARTKSNTVSALFVPQMEEDRPISSILHMPNPDVAIDVMPLSPERNASLIDVDGIETPRAFGNRALHRYRLFLDREAASKDDSDRLNLFCQFMVAESRIRRDRYAAVFKAEGLESADLTQGMFEVLASKSDDQPSQSLDRNGDKYSRRSSGTTFSGSRSYSRRASTTATSEPILTLDTSVGAQAQGDTSRSKDYVPCLSPIASMSAVTGRDEMDSRGRTPSRWWESQSGDSSREDGFRVLERTKRESRYMALPQEARNSPRPFGTEISPAVNQPYYATASTSHQSMYGPSEYPIEKLGWHEEPIPPPPPQPPTPMSAPFTPDPRKLDISRLVTLPPPFPRHHPAVNNSHPELATVRAIVRSLNESDGNVAARDEYKSKVQEKRTRADSWCKHQRSLHAQDIQYHMEHGQISQEEFDQAEAAIEAKEAQSKKELLQAEFDLFQSTVVSPLHALFSERITKATAAFEQLASRLSSDAQSNSPNLPQEEGDEQPELLEKLTQLKWLFEAREHLHKETYNLLSERNEKYRGIVLHPYTQSRNYEKLADAKSFFEKDALARRAAHEKAALERHEAFLAVIEAHVTRGVEIQISAFWDIAPSLMSLLQDIPNGAGLPGFEILIPRAEVEENPAYWSHPLRYLYSLLNHAEASSRQFIESQVSLWCLLQEIREGASGARWRVDEADARLERRDLGWQGEENRVALQKALVEDLKEKVGVVEGQWDEALGGEIRRVKEGVRAWLVESGGWDEELAGE